MLFESQEIFPLRSYHCPEHYVDYPVTKGDQSHEGWMHISETKLEFIQYFMFI